MTFTLKIKNFINNRVFWIFILSFIVRFYFVFLNYPFVFHPDEPTVINSTINLRYNLNPAHFDWPTTFYYLNYPIYTIFERVTGKLTRDFKFTFQISEIDYYVISRTLSSLLGSLNVVLIYLILINLKKTEIQSEMGAVVFSLFLFHITRSAQALIDVPMLFFASLSVYFLTKNYLSDKLSNYYFACFFAGLSVSTKYNGYMIFLSIFLYILWVRGFKIKDWFFYLKCSFASAFGFFLGTPYALFDYKTFFRSDSPKGALWQFQNVGKVSIGEQVVSFFTNFYNSLDLVGYLPLIISAIFIIYLLYWILNQKNKDNDTYHKIVWIFIIQFLYVIWSVSGIEVQRSQYIILILMFIPIFWVLFFEKFPKYSTSAFLVYLGIALFGILNSYENRPITEFYTKVVFSSDKYFYNFLYTNNEYKKVLDKLEVAADKYEGGISNLNSDSKYSHILSSTDMCEAKSGCNLTLIRLIESKRRSDKLYIYEIKR